MAKKLILVTGPDGSPLVLLDVESDCPPLELDDIASIVGDRASRFLPPYTFELYGGAELGGATITRDDRRRWLWVCMRNGRLVAAPVATMECLERRLAWLHKMQALLA